MLKAGFSSSYPIAKLAEIAIFTQLLFSAIVMNERTFEQCQT